MTLLEVVVGMILLMFTVSSSASAWSEASQVALKAQSQWATDVAADNAAEDYLAGSTPGMVASTVGGRCVVTVSEVRAPSQQWIHITSSSAAGFQSLWLFE